MVRVNILVVCDSVKRGVPKISVKTIKNLEENKVYVFSKEHQNAENHNELFSILSITRAVKVLDNNGDFREMMVTLPEDISVLYLNEEQNFVFQDYLLAVISPTESKEIAESKNFDIIIFIC